MDTTETVPRTAPQQHRTAVVLAYALFTLIGLGAGVTGVLLLPQMADYIVDRTTIGLIFFTGSAGFFLASATAGPLIHRYGTRAILLVGGAAYIAAALYTAVRPPFLAFVLIQLLAGYGTGLLESVLNAFLAALPKATTKLNRLHAFFGVGALIGPLLATWMLTFTSWPVVWLVLAGICIPLTLAVLAAYPTAIADPTRAVSLSTEDAGKPRKGGLVGAALRQPAVLFGAALLGLYVGLELGVGNWGYSYLVDARTVPAIVAGYSVSGYWLGLTLGRFLLSPIASRIGLNTVGLMYLSIGGVVGATALTWLVPSAAIATVGFILLGFFLGPIFPTTMAVAPQLTSASLVPTAIGIMNAGSVVGGSALPWLAGAVAQGVGAWTLLPFAFALGLAQLVVWWRIARRVTTQR